MTPVETPNRWMDSSGGFHFGWISTSSPKKIKWTSAEAGKSSKVGAYLNMSSFWMDKHFIVDILYFGNMVFKIPQKKRRVLNEARSGKNSHTSDSPNQPLSLCFDISGNLDLEKLIRKLSVSAQVPGTVGLLCPKPFEHLVFRLQSQRGKIPRFPDSQTKENSKQKMTMVKDATDG